MISRTKEDPHTRQKKLQHALDHSCLILSRAPDVGEEEVVLLSLLQHELRRKLCGMQPQGAHVAVLEHLQKPGANKQERCGEDSDTHNDDGIVSRAKACLQTTVAKSTRFQQIVNLEEGC